MTAIRLPVSKWHRKPPDVTFMYQKKAPGSENSGPQGRRRSRFYLSRNIKRAAKVSK
jgi:hypothetical protein